MSSTRPYKAQWLASEAFSHPPEPPYQETYPVLLQDGSYLELPLQPFPDGQKAIALLMSNQTPFAVEAALTPLLTQIAQSFNPEVIVGVPTLGLDYARLVAQQLGFPNYVALGNSRKFWYDDNLSVPVVSVTSPNTHKSLFIDPGLIDRVNGKRAVIVDDVINTGGTAIAAIQLLRKVGADFAGLAVVLTEGHDWEEALQNIGVNGQQQVRAAGHIPIFQRTEAGWKTVPETM